MAGMERAQRYIIKCKRARYKQYIWNSATAGNPCLWLYTHKLSVGGLIRTKNIGRKKMPRGRSLMFTDYMFTLLNFELCRYITYSKTKTKLSS